MLPNPSFESRSAIDSLLSVENAVKDHYLFYQSEMGVQRGILDRMWVIAQRYTILTKGGPSKRTEHSTALHRVEDEIKIEFLTKLASLNDSNSKLYSSLTNVKDTFRELIEALTETDTTYLASENQDDCVWPPISYNIELFADFLKFFDHTQSTLNCYGHLLTPDNILSTERYKKLLKPNEDFNDHFLKSMAYYSYSHLLKQKRSK